MPKPAVRPRALLCALLLSLALPGLTGCMVFPGGRGGPGGPGGGPGISISADIGAFITATARIAGRIGPGGVEVVIGDGWPGGGPDRPYAPYTPQPIGPEGPPPPDAP